MNHINQDPNPSEKEADIPSSPHRESSNAANFEGMRLGSPTLSGIVIEPGQDTRENINNQSAPAGIPSGSESGATPGETSGNRLSEIWKQTKNHLNPFYYYNVVCSAYSDFKESCEHWRYSVTQRAEELQQAFSAKAVSCLVLSDAVAELGAICGIGAQVATGNKWVAMGVTMATGYGIAVGVFQGAWAVANKELYKRNADSPLRGLIEMEKDLWPLHKHAFIAAMKCYSISIPVNSALIYLSDQLPPAVSAVVPVPIILSVTSITIFESMFLIQMIKFNKKFSEQLAQKYTTEE